MDNPMSVWEYGQYGIGYGKAPERQSLHDINIKKVEQLLSDIIEGRKEAIERDVDEIFREIHAIGADYRLVGFYRDYLQLKLLKLSEQQAAGLSRQEILTFIGEHDFQPEGMKSSRSRFKKFACDFALFRMQADGQGMSGLLLRIEKDICENYMQDISLKSLSEKYYISRPYLGQIFRKQFGVCFKDYLNRVRLENAERLLLETNEKIYNIAAMVGYHNSDYFINKFLQARGLTPARFRRQAFKTAGNE